jgi:hypothetical protein
MAFRNEGGARPKKGLKKTKQASERAKKYNELVQTAFFLHRNVELRNGCGVGFALCSSHILLIANQKLHSL